MMKNDSVRIRKVAAVDSPVWKTAAVDAYVPGHVNPDMSPPIAYEIEGELLRDVVIGEAMTAFRRKRNGIEVPGVFESTSVVDIERMEDRTIVKTENSVYEVIPLSPPNEGLPI